MKHTILTFFAACVVILFFAGCELTTNVPKPNHNTPADHVIINEVFTLPPSNPLAYSWIELYNPSSTKIPLFTVLRDSSYRDSSITRPPGDTSIVVVHIVRFRAFYFKIKADVFFQNPIAPFEPPVPGGNRVVYFPVSSVVNRVVFSPDSMFSLGDSVMAPNSYSVYCNNVSRLQEHVGLGGAGVLQQPIAMALNDSLVSLGQVVPTQFDATIFPIFTIFQLPVTSEISIVERTQILRKHAIDLGFGGIQIFSIDSSYTVSENVIDVVRYGNYSLQPYDTLQNGAQLQPLNKSAGFIPNFYSLARYANGYISNPANSASDFYMERQPIPMWNNSTRHK